MSPTTESCAWCALPKSKQGLVVGICGAVLLHVVALAGLSMLSDRVPAKQNHAVRVIDLGSITIHVPKKSMGMNAPKEI